MKWSATGAVHGSKYLGRFEAASKEEALEKAQDEACVSLCHQCSRECEDPEIDSITVEGEDGTVYSDAESWEEKAKRAGWKPPTKAKSKSRRA